MATPAFFGPELHVNTTTANDQDKSSVTALANGKFVVVWEDSSTTGGDTSSDAVRGQVFNADGSKAGGEFLVNQTTANGQILPVVTGLTDGRFVVAWEDTSATGGDASGSAIRARIFNVDGAPASDEFLVNTTTTNDQFDPAIAALAGGGFVVTWTREFSSTDLDIRGRAFDSTGTPLGDDFTVDQSDFNDETESAIVALANGNYAIVWTDAGSLGTDGSGSKISAKIMSGAGTIVVDEFIVNTTTANDQRDPAIALLSDGNFIVTWTSDVSTSNDDVRGRVFSPTGVPLGPDFLIDGDQGPEFGSSVSALANGAYAVAWTNNSSGADAETDGSLNHVRAEFLSGADGTGIGDEFIVNTTTNGAQSQSSLATLADGRLVATWSDFGGNLGDESHGVRAQIIDPRTAGVNLIGGALADDWVGTGFADIMKGNGGEDRIDGAGGNDPLFGGEGNDALFGGDGDDLLEGGAGADFLFGGDGIDTISYASSAAGVVVGLGQAGAFGGDSTGDQFPFFDVENIVGSAFADSLSGDQRNNVIDGGAGADVMFGARGNDTYGVDDAGDIVDESSTNGGVDTVLSSISFDLADAVHAKGEVENLILTDSAANGFGNALANTIVGNAAANFLSSAAGNDRLEGDAGNDALSGGADNDTMIGGAGNDDYFVDDAGDEVVEKADEGSDTVTSSIDYTLAADVENLFLNDDFGNAVVGIGNSLANNILGNDFANVLDGKGGQDTMTGGRGDDSYVVDDAGDKVVEKASEGTDTVVTSVAFVLGDNLENLRLVGAADTVAKATIAGVNGTGNAFANAITGSDGGNLIDGGAGSDTLRGEDGRDKMIGGDGDDTVGGGRGKDKLLGGDGRDSFLFAEKLSKANADRIAGFKVKDDTFLLDDAIFDGLGLGTLTKKAYFEGEAAHDKNDRVILTDKGKLLFDADGKGGDKALLFAKVGKDVDLSHNDFLVI